jgi:site-specific DNA-methyltransferase (adenine-specific)
MCIEVNKIYLGDCIEVMKDIESYSIDMILCDLPQGITQNKWDIIIPFASLWEQYERIAKDKAAIVLFGNQPFSSQLVCSNLNLFKYEWIWEKDKATGHLNANHRPMKSHEQILVFYKSPPTYNPQKYIGNPCHSRGTATGTVGKTPNYGKHVGVETTGNMKFPLSIIKFNKEWGLHPTQKPVPLLEYLIKTYTNENDIVLDNCVGSGSTVIACENTHRKFIGIEGNAEYCEIARCRIASGDS